MCLVSYSRTFPERSPLMNVLRSSQSTLITSSLGGGSVFVSKNQVPSRSAQMTKPRVPPTTNVFEASSGLVADVHQSPWRGPRSNVALSQLSSTPLGHLLPKSLSLISLLNSSGGRSFVRENFEGMSPPPRVVALSLFSAFGTLYAYYRTRKDRTVQAINK